MLCFTLLPLTGLLVFVPLSKLIARLALRGHSKDAVKPLPWYRRGILRGTTALILLGIIFGVVRRTLPEDSLAYTHGFVVICVVILVLDYLLARASKLIRWLPGRATRDSALFGHLMELAEQFRLRLRAVELVDADHFRPPLVMRRGVLRIRTDIAEELSRDELDFAAAAEFAQLARRHTYNEALLLTIATAVTSIYGYLFISEPPNLSVMNVKMWGTILGLLMFIIEGNWLRRSRARAADLAALECTGDAKAAVDAVMKVSGLLDRMQNPTKHLRNPQIDLLTPARLAWLRKAAGDENIIAPSILGGLTEDEALTDRAQEIAARLNVELKKVWVAESAMGKPLVNAFAIRGGKLAVGREILDSFSRAEIDFVLAHEAAHLKSKHGTRMLISISAGFLILIIGVAISSSGDLPLKGPGLWVCMAGCAILTGSMTWMNRLRELEADRIALGITRDLPAAVSVINKLAAGNVKLPEELESYNSHPKYAYRINKLKATARKLGIPDDVEPAYVEDSALGHPDRVGAHIEDDAE
jgi:Zn-dependent protease with chaperone function